MLRSAFIPKLWLVLTSTLNPPFWSSAKSSSRSSDVVVFISSCSWVELSPLLAKLQCSLSSAVRALTVLLVVLVDGKRGFVTFMNVSGYWFTLYIHFLPLGLYWFYLPSCLDRKNAAVGGICCQLAAYKTGSKFQLLLSQRWIRRLGQDIIY